MNFAAVYHRSTPDMCYSPDGSEVVVNIRTGREVDAVYLVHEDPFIHELNRRREWYGRREKMTLSRELAYQVVYTLRVRPEYKRLMYYFELEADGKTYCLFENKLCEKSAANDTSKQFFKYGWLNPSDIISPPSWVGDTVWYQIMPDRFCRHKDARYNEKFRVWGDLSNPNWYDCYGGTLKGITERLDYLHGLGISGIYMTPIFESNSSHKYNTFDYTKIDPDFGTEDDLRELVREAHRRGIRVMLDAVFNHCGHKFAPLLDVCEKGRESKYFDWFFINFDDFMKDDFTTADGRFYSFSFWAPMPKLNTNNPEVQRYFTDLCVHWVGDLDIDGIRFDVGDEISHSFLRRVNAAVKTAKPETFLLGEIWFDAIGWLGGCEYDSVMNYPFTGAVGDFWRDREMTARDFMHRLNFCRSLYPRQINEALFSFLDTHDTARVRESCRNQNEMLQKLAILLTMAGTPCLYYGTEIAMKGAHTPYNRSTMPWDEIDAGKFDRFKSKVSALVRVRSEQPDLRRDEMDFFFDESLPRLVGYRKGAVTVLLNAGDTPAPVAAAQEILFSNGYKNGTLLPDGVLLCK